ncbi:iron utilization protein [Stenotrophomonas ginsengisoli]|uniref:Iron utilization protein n=1 Tax=Stenotrophomonas ginsengisoli TaxID=336566 RepID=A0A0R0DL36_9GAMM|nr:siderophore-interacting protein [Stenotrophomonas ginsengisoli]KRG78740.1 iron utilization protein [Stenotrophomonas ginsengisoli]
MSDHQNTLIRLPLQFRQLQVLHSERLSEHMQRITVGGPELAGFASPGADDHVKLFFPNADGAFVLPELTEHGPRYPDGALPSPSRDYTPRHVDSETGELVLDFVLHGAGPATSWALRAQPGDDLVVGGPRGSFALAQDFDGYVLLGDETALPAIARFIEQLPEHAEVQAYIEIPDHGDRLPLDGGDNVRIQWLERGGYPAHSSQLLEDVLTDIEEPEGDVFYWVACESRRARQMRQFIEGHMQVPKDWIRATGYWKANPADEDA